MFRHGVASFDPTHDRVIIWTRVTVPDAQAASASKAVEGGDVEAGEEVQWQVSRDDAFKVLVRSGVAIASPLRDYTVSVDVTGLPSSTRFRYRFVHRGTPSRVGTTRTFAAPGEPMESLTFALFSCANFGFGYFHAFDLASRLDGLELVVFGGDYIYEYEEGFYPDPGFEGRSGLEPKCRLATLADYRARYACHRGKDEGLRRLHACAPWISVWDDHELADSCYVTGAEEWEGTVGEWKRRIPVALQAYAEWVPVRGMDPLDPQPRCGGRSFFFGNLASLTMLETRVWAREQPLDVSKTRFYALTAKKPVDEWDDDAIADARAELIQLLREPSRRLLGDEQMQALKDTVARSVRLDQPFQFVLSQVVMGTLRAPLLTQTLRVQPKLFRKICTGALNLATDPKVAGEEGAELARMYLALGKYGLPMNPDAWDGYAGERERAYDALRVPGASPVVLSGDSHNCWVQELRDDRANPVGVEFASPAVTSIGAFEDIYSRFEAKSSLVSKLFPLELFTPWIEDAMKAANPITLRYANLNERGVVFVRATQTECHAEMHFVTRVDRKTYKHHCGAAFDVTRDEPGKLKKAVRYLTVDGVIPKRRHTKRGALIHGIHDISQAMDDA